MNNSLEYLEKEIKNTQIIVLAGGVGSRMGNDDLPKALLMINDKPLLYYFIKQYTSLGFVDFKFLLGHQAQEIINYINASNFGINSTYSIEPKSIKGKAKAVKFAIENDKIDLNKRAIIAFPDDYFFNPNLPIEFLLRHILGVKTQDIFVTICYTNGTIYPFGTSKIDNEHLVQSFEEKPFIKQNTNTGLYLVEPEFFKEIAVKINLDSLESIEIEKAIFPDLALRQKIFSMIIPASLWLSINTMKELKEARKRLS